MTGRPNLQANFIQQSSLMLALALGVESQCGPAVLADTDPAYFHCWDMASPEALSPGGDFVPDGEVNVLDYGRQVRLQNLTGLGVNTFMLLSQAGAVLTPSGALEGPSECARRRRNLAATIVANWHVSCPSNLAANRCYYDCNEAPACLHSVAPVLSEVLSGGSWYRVQLPSGWTAFSLLFDVGMGEWVSGSARRRPAPHAARRKVTHEVNTSRRPTGEGAKPPPVHWGTTHPALKTRRGKTHGPRGGLVRGVGPKMPIPSGREPSGPTA